MKVTVSINRKGNLRGFAEILSTAASAGLQLGGEMMSEVVEATANDMARFPTGELESSIHYEHLQDGEHPMGRIVAGTDHALPFHEGAEEHFVPYNEADERIKAGLYGVPVYRWESPEDHYGPDGPEMPYTFYKEDDPRADVNDDEENIIGYIISSASHPFMKDGFEAAKDTVVQEVANQIAVSAGR